MKITKLSFLIFAASLLGQSQIFAQATWVGADLANWNVPANWTGTAPVDNGTSSLTFNSASNRTSNNGLNNLTVSPLTISGGSDNTITGNNFTLSGDVTVSTGSWQAINTGIGLTGNRKFIVSNGQLTLGGALTDGTSAGGILKEGGSPLILKGAGSMTGVSTQTVLGGNPGAGSYTVPLLFNAGGAGAVVLQNTAALGSASLKGIQFNSSGGGTLDLQTDTSVNSYGIFAGSGGTATIIANRLTSVANANITHNLGVVQLGSASLTINKGGNVTGSGVAMVTFSAVSLSAGNNNSVVTLNGSAAISLGNVATTANASNNRRLGLAGTHASNAVTGVISNLAPTVTGASVLSLIKSDPSTWTLTGANTYTGITTIAGGTLQLGNGGATGTLNSASAIQNGGTLAINRSGTITQGTDFAATIAAYTTDYSANAAGAALGSPVLGKLVKSGSGNLILNASNTLAAADALTFSGGGSGTVTLTHVSALGAAGNSVRFSGGGSGTLDLQTNTSVNAYNFGSGSGNGGTITANRATSGASVSHALGFLDLSSVTLTVNKGSNVTGTAAVSFTELKMTGGNDNNPVTLSGNAAISVGNVATTFNTYQSRRLGLAGTDANNAVTGVISNLGASMTGASVLSLIKSDSSTWTLTGANTYTGITTIAGGTLQLGNGGATGTLNSASAIQNGGALAINRSGTITQGTDFAATIAAYITDYSTNATGTALSSAVLGKLVKSGSGNLILNASNTLAAADALTFSGGGSGTVTLTHASALGAAGNSVRFSGGGSGTLDLQTDTSGNAYNFVSGSFNGGTIIANRATSGASVSHALGVLDLSSVTLTVNKGSNVTGTAAVSFTELKMGGGNDFNPVTLAGSADISISSASITNNGFAKRLQLDGTSANNVVTGVISDTANATGGTPKVNLIKANSSTWHLQGNNTYTGDTTINAGTLKLDFPCLDNTSTVSVAGTLQLNYSGTDVVGALYLGGVLKGPGIYDSGNSSGYISGAGKIQILGASAFDSWAQTNITAISPAADATATGDPDGDGVTNLSEFAFKGNPLSGSDNGIVRTFIADSSADVDSDKELILTIAIRKGGAAFSGTPLQLAVAGITYTLEGSLDLTNFNAGVIEVAPITTGLPDLSGNPDYEYRSFSLAASNGLLGKGFLRAKVAN